MRWLKQLWVAAALAGAVGVGLHPGVARAESTAHSPGSAVHPRDQFDASLFGAPRVRPVPARSHIIGSGVSTIAGFTAKEKHALLRRKLVSRPFVMRDGDARYIGGVSYLLVRATPLEITSALFNVKYMPRTLPHTKRVIRVAKHGELQRVEIVQGKGFLEGRYTVYVEQQQDAHVIRFWLDPERPHDVRDLWGYFKAEAFEDDYSLVTIVAALDLGPGIVQSLFESNIQDEILRMPLYVREFVEPRSAATRRLKLLRQQSANF